MKRQRRKRRGLSYGVLESRQLLVATGLAQFDGDSTIQSGLIANGGFDENAIAESTSEHVELTNVAGWNQSTDASDTVSLVGFDPDVRATALHLDFDPDAVESVFQDIDTESGQAYTLAFDLIGRDVDAAADATTNEIRINWDGQEVGRYRGISIWQTFVVDVTGGSSDLTRLEIQEIDGAGNDGIGPIIDNIRLVPVTGLTVENGSFENNASGVVSQNDVPGWSVIAAEGQESVDIQDTAASDGSRYLNLDRQSDQSDILFTNVATEAGGVYFISFDMRAESGNVGEDEEMRIRWNDNWVGTYRADASWQSYGITVRADSDSTRLVFREAGDGFTGDGSGPLLDNIRIMQVNSALSFSLSDSLNFSFTENQIDFDIGDRVNSINSTINETTLTGFSATLGANADSATESISIDIIENGSTATQTSENGVLTVSGNRSVAEYLEILRTLRYENTSENPVAGARQVTITVSAGSVSSLPAVFTINVVPENDAPVVNNISDVAAEVGQEFTALATANDPEGDAITWSITSVTGSAIDAADTQPFIDAAGLVRWTPAREGDAVITVRATDTDGLFDEREFSVIARTVTVLDTGNVTVNAGTALPLFDADLTTDPAVGQTLADFEAQTITGGSFSSVEPGVSRIYSMLAHWCPACNAELPEISQWLLDNNLGSDIEFVATAVSVDSTRANYPPANWFDNANFTGTVIVDSQQARIMELMGTQTFPFLVAVDASGQVVERIASVTTTAQLDAVLATLRS